MSTQKVTFAVLSILINDIKSIVVKVFRDEEEAQKFNSTNGDIFKQEEGVLCATKAACKAWLLSEIASDSVAWLKGESGNTPETLDMCRTIVNLHRYTNKANVSLRSVFRRNDNDRDWLANYKLAFGLIDELPNDLFVGVQIDDSAEDDHIEHVYESPY